MTCDHITAEKNKTKARPSQNTRPDRGQNPYPQRINWLGSDLSFNTFRQDDLQTHPAHRMTPGPNLFVMTG